MNLELIKQKPLQHILQFSIPSIIAMVLTSLITITDGFFIGNYISSDGLAAVNLGLPIVYLFLAIGLMISVGGRAISGIAFGAGDKSKAKNVFNQTIATTFIASILTGIVVALIFSPMIKFLGATGKVASLAKDYYLIMLFEYPLMVLNTSFGMFIRCDGKPQKYMQISVINVVLNILLNYVFVGFTNFGIKGIAYASLISSIVATILNVLFFVKDSSTYKFSRFKFYKEDAKT